MKTFTDATDEFLKSLTHIEGVDSASIAALENAAKQLDIKFSATLLAEYSKTVRYIKSLNPETDEDEAEDPLLSPKS